MRQSGFEPPLTPLRYYALEGRSGTGALCALTLICLTQLHPVFSIQVVYCRASVWLQYPY